MFADAPMSSHSLTHFPFFLIFHEFSSFRSPRSWLKKCFSFIFWSKRIWLNLIFVHKKRLLIAYVLPRVTSIEILYLYKRQNDKKNMEGDFAWWKFDIISSFRSLFPFSSRRFCHCVMFKLRKHFLVLVEFSLNLHYFRVYEKATTKEKNERMRINQVDYRQNYRR